MAKRNILIPIRLVKPYNRKRSTRDLLLFSCSHLVKTKGLKVVKPCIPKLANHKLLRKGVLGVVKSPVLSSDGKITVSRLDAYTVAQVIAGKARLGGDLVIITQTNKVRPFHLPDLSDLALLPKAMKFFVQWVISTQGGEGGCGLQHVIPKSIINVIDPPSDLPTVVECCDLSTGNHQLKIPSYRNDCKLFTTKYPLLVTNIYMRSTIISSSILDGRKMEVEVKVVANEHGMCWSGSSLKGLWYMVWNCRDMGRETFLPLLRSAIEMHMPHLVILTESRVSIHMARHICAFLKPYAVYGVSKTESEGGYAMLAFTSHVSMKMSSSFSNEYCWAIDVL